MYIEIFSSQYMRRGLYVAYIAGCFFPFVTLSYSIIQKHTSFSYDNQATG